MEENINFTNLKFKDQLLTFKSHFSKKFKKKIRLIKEYKFKSVLINSILREVMNALMFCKKLQKNIKIESNITSKK